MRGSIFVLVLSAAGLAAAPELFAKGGDAIRSRAPITALLFDLRASYRAPLESAYFDDEIDFFLDYQGAANSVVSDLYNLREAGRRLADGDTVSARNFLRLVRSYGNERTFVEASILAAEGSYETSSKLFKSLIEKRREISRKLLTSAFMGAARVAHEVGDFKQAIFYFTRVPQLSPQFFEAIFEKGWSFYMNGDMNGSLGASLAFLTPYAENYFYPEATIYRAASFYHLCLFERANQTIEAMKKEFIPLQAQIQELRGRSPASWLFDENVLNTIDRRVLGYMMNDTRYRSLQRARLALEVETKRLSGEYKRKGDEALQFVKQRIAQEAARVMEKLDRDVAKALGQADEIQIEILQLGVNVLVGAPIEMRDDIRIIQLGDVDFSELVQFWPFKGEFWADEIGSYYYGLKSVCESRPL